MPSNPELFFTILKGIGGGEFETAGVATKVTLRDLFAAFALDPITLGTGDDDGDDPARIAAQCYKLADAMLAERERKS